jgi:hypothetical protein
LKNPPLPRRHRHGGGGAAAAAPPWTSLLPGLEYLNEQGYAVFSDVFSSEKITFNISLV